MRSHSTPKSSPAVASVCKRVHPEDIQVGDFLAPATVSYEVPTFAWPCLAPALFPPDRTIRLTLPGSLEGVPLRVDAICLPFLLCQKVDRESVVLDVRQTQVFRLDREFAKRVRNSLRPTKKRKKRKSKRKKRVRRG